MQPKRGHTAPDVRSGARGATEQLRQASDVVHARNGAVRLVEAEHQAQVERVPRGQRGLQPLLHDVEIIVAVVDGAAERCRGLLPPDQLDRLGLADVATIEMPLEPMGAP